MFTTLINRSLCLFLGHIPERTGAKGYVDRIEQVQTYSGPGRVPVRTVAEIARCRRSGCKARRVEVDMAPLSDFDRRMRKWVVA